MTRTEISNSLKTIKGKIVHATEKRAFSHEVAKQLADVQADIDQLLKELDGTYVPLD